MSALPLRWLSLSKPAEGGGAAVRGFDKLSHRGTERNSVSALPLRWLSLSKPAEGGGAAVRGFDKLSHRTTAPP
ncbi:hypothetical protein [Candidatus Viridilinea mediisalina]|uniref:Uncharacterized protein n=1 Tax=Candidatus Viridilinea mediisalina TaxID=2024553 RepID=A0A2A6RFX6_9CHLR|nr:hypothetical protein [Candidatus Viridilinea mediisalina]PDW01788.1 hypothetical protein CJ255_17265 [Candidatus Viridilinea mediisalina]